MHFNSLKIPSLLTKSDSLVCLLLEFTPHDSLLVEKLKYPLVLLEHPVKNLYRRVYIAVNITVRNNHNNRILLLFYLDWFLLVGYSFRPKFKLHYLTHREHIKQLPKEKKEHNRCKLSEVFIVLTLSVILCLPTIVWNNVDLTGVH